MEGSIITVDTNQISAAPVYAKVYAKSLGENPRVLESTPLYYYCQIRRGDRTRFLGCFSRKLNQSFGRTERTPVYYYCQIRRGDRTRLLERFPRKLNQGFGRIGFDSRAAFAAQRLKWHGPQNNSFPLLYNDRIAILSVEKEIDFPWSITIFRFLLCSMSHYSSCVTLR